MNILVLGGSVFVGRAIVAEALARGHDVTTLSRGRNGDIPDGATPLTGDRALPDGLSALGNREFDAVVDTSRQALSHVRRAAEALEPRTGRYLFVSTVSVYTELAATGTDETAPVAAPLLEPTAEQEDDPACYPGLNVACEQTVQAVFADRAVVLRPCLVAGARDPSDRFGYWTVRAARGGAALAPGDPGRLVQFVDVADLAAFAVHCLEQSLHGTFNVRGPGRPTTMATLLDACGRVTGGTSTWEWADDDFLLSHGMRPYMDMPLWLPDRPDYSGFDQIDGSRALAAGLTHRSLDATVQSAFEWETRCGLDRPRKAGLEPANESSLLDAWHAHARDSSGPREKRPS